MKERNMSYYLVCHRKRNNPRMDVRICEKKCPWKEDCQEYIQYHKGLAQNETPPLTSESQSPNLEAA
jgi:hypothetical protein